MTVLLQISDPHFGTEVPAVVQALADLAQEQAPQVVVWSGDITQRSRRAQWQAASRFAARLAAAHTLAIPGNHDIALFNLAERAIAPYASFRRSFGAELEPVLALPDLLVQGVNTTRPWRHKHGQVSDAQIERVARRLGDAEARQWRVIVTHQPVHVTRAEDHVNLLRGHERAIERWAAAGADIVLGGHIHLPFVRELATRQGRLFAVQAGTALSHRVRHGSPNSVNLLRFMAPRPSGCRIERWDYSERVQRFARIAQVDLG